jgi:hypothetical protein
MTSNLDELKAKLYAQFDKACDGANTFNSGYKAEDRSTQGRFIQAAAQVAEVIVAIEQGKTPAVRK